jgi:hypothetical protein
MGQRDQEGSQAGEEEQEQEQLKIIDRRLFTSDGEPRSPIPDDDESSAASEGERARMPEPPAGNQDFERRPVEEPKGCDFTMLINGMAEPALLFLGEIPHPGSDQPSVDLDRARIQIDMLDLLRVKCRGNLTREEEGLLDRILYQLRMLYVARAKQPES